MSLCALQIRAGDSRPPILPILPRLHRYSMDNSDAPTTFTSTITSGIQDISALLPLLGTEQCETHVGSALAEGYLYAAASPLSIFGILGIARAGIKTLLATLTLPSSQVTRGAEHLRDAGFTPTGESLSLIMMDPNHRHRHLAESKLDSLIKEFHLAEKLKVKTPWKERHLLISLMSSIITTVILVVSSILWLLLFPLSCAMTFEVLPGAIRLFILERYRLCSRRIGLCISQIRSTDWNTRLVAVTFIMSAISICPYLYLIVKPNRLPHPLPLVFPVMRACGGFLVSVSIQILIERRLSRIIQCRLAFHRLDQEVRTIIADLKKSGDKVPIWDNSKSAEVCLYSIQGYLQALGPSTTLRTESTSARWRNLFNPNAVTQSTDAEQGNDPNLRNRVDAEIYNSGSLTLWPYHVLLTAGLAALVVGYVGCFSVVQNAPSAKAPLIWLVVEAALSVLRLFLWGCDPKFDDPQPIKFFLECAPKSIPLVACTCAPILEDRPSPTETRPIVLKAMPYVAFINKLMSRFGFMRRLNHSGFQFYFALTRSSFDWHRPTKRFLIIAFHHEKSVQDWVVWIEHNERTEEKVYQAKITSDSSPYVTVEVGEPRPRDGLMYIDPNLITLIVNYGQVILDGILEHERPYRILDAGALPDQPVGKKEASWAPSAHSPSVLMVGPKGSSEKVESKLFPRDNVGTGYLDHNFSLDSLQMNLERDYPDRLNYNSTSEPLGDVLLKVYISILAEENVELELIALAGCRIWLDHIQNQFRHCEDNFDVIEYPYYQAELIWPKFNERRRTIEKILGLLDNRHQDEKVFALVEWNRAMSSRLDASWKSMIASAITPPSSPTVSTAESLLNELTKLREQLKLGMEIVIPKFELNKDSFLRDESNFHILLARIQEQFNFLQGERQVCFPEDGFDFTHLNPWTPQKYNFIIHMQQNFTFVDVRQTANTLNEILRELPPELRSRITFKLCSHHKLGGSFAFFDDTLKLLFLMYELFETIDG